MTKRTYQPKIRRRVRCPWLQESHVYLGRAESIESQKAQRSLPLDRYKEQSRQEGQLEGMIAESVDFTHDSPVGR